MQTYTYLSTYLCFMRLRDTFSFKYRKMVTKITFEVYIFIANKYNYMKNNCIPLISVFYKYFLNELLCLILLVTLEQLSVHLFLDLSLFLLIFWALWTYIYMRPAKTIGLDYERIYAFGKSYQHRLWHIYAFANFFDLKHIII